MPHTIACCPKRVLVIDDNTDLAETLGVVLGMCGHCVETAFTGADGIRKARSFVPEVIICDVGMPRLDGLAVAKTLRCDPQLKRVRLIALTAHDYEQQAQAAGFDHFLLKPPDLRRLAKLVAD